MSCASVAYVSASTNRHSHSADASSASLVAFGSSKLVALWDAGDKLDRGIHATLPGHEGLVICVCFVQADCFVSADDRGVVRYWRRDEDQWNTKCVTKAHEKAISALAVHGEILVTGASDSLIKVWRLVSKEHLEELQEVQAISLRGRYPLSIAVTSLPATEAIILAIGTTDQNIQIWTRSDGQFVCSAALSGHEDWIRSLAFQEPVSDNDPLILASGSQDATIRLWNIEPYTRKTTENASTHHDALSDELLDAFEASLGDLGDAEEGGRQISLKRHILTVKSAQYGAQQFSITFDALLVGHEGGVTSLSWRPRHVSASTPTLLSTSTDSSLILWSPSTILTSSAKDGSTSIWIDRQRFGDVGGQRLGGFVGGLWTCDGSEASAWGWGGGWRRWRCRLETIDGSPYAQNENWSEVGAIGGHSAAVRGLSWSPRGEYLISTGLDQTTRIHAEIPTPDEDETQTRVWHELSRPQVHGYDLVGVAFLDALRFVSIADEKVARVFEAPREFVELCNNLRVSNLDTDGRERPRAATVPPLGLSNKAVTEVIPDTMNISNTYDADRRNRRPFEGELAAVTLWPEIEKIFGHGYESITLAISNSHKLMATACKATTPEHAVIRVFDTQRWQSLGQPLTGHALTVTRIAFSPDDRFLLSVSRDRSWRLFAKDGQDGYVPAAADKTHSRIIWDCAWAHEGDIFATASRDKTVRIWHPTNTEGPKKWTSVSTIRTAEAATAVAFAPSDRANRRRLAIGLESGEIQIYSCLQTSSSEWSLDLTIDFRTAHVDQIHRLMWRPTTDNTTMQLASCSEDSTLKVLTVHIAKSG
ncbi:hypothetical protein AcV5_000934 [Taiwanofungus camphoratus]|nr:hypothetical protein AcV5_000934 [Antrodia cinnamomea]KAI0952470.1 hypothetical protein AcV7_008264 [Antrodia cinnamomea]